MKNVTGRLFLAVCLQILATAIVKMFISEDSGLHDSLYLSFWFLFTSDISENTFFTPSSQYLILYPHAVTRNERYA